MSTEVIWQYPTDNVARNYATIGVNSGSEDADYPAAYLADGRPGRPAKLTTNAGSWVFDFGSATRVDLVALGAHNITAATIEANATNAWGSPTLSAALTIPAPTADGHSVNAWLDLTAVTGYSAGGFQYWRLVVSGSVPCAVGELWLGSQKRVAERNYMWGFGVGETHANIAHMTEFMVPLVYALGSRQRQLGVTFRASDAGALLLREWFRAMKGVGLTSVFIPDSTTNDAWWIRQAQDYAEAATYPDARDVSMTLVEHATGVPL
jgi:hypothetical protein